MDTSNFQRKIIHIDMDAFYASVEQMDNPLLKGKPIAVGGNENRGVVSAASYEARKFGVRSALSGVLAKKYCPDLIFVRPRFDRYKEISKQIQSIFHEYTDLVEPLSLDEAYLDVTHNKKGNPSATLLANEIRARILSEVGLTASAGISVNKFIAKVASDYNKPNGQKTVSGDEIAQNKRHIDGFNQARNDATERVDEEILVRMKPVSEFQNSGARLNSETAGAMMDRMSIMSLKIKAMRAQTVRTDVDAVHIEKCTEKLNTLLEPRADLGACLDGLLADMQAGRAYYKIYRQFKMYNDKTLNPELVKEQVR